MISQLQLLCVCVWCAKETQQTHLPPTYRGEEVAAAISQFLNFAIVEANKHIASQFLSEVPQ